MNFCKFSLTLWVLLLCPAVTWAVDSDLTPEMSMAAITDGIASGASAEIFRGVIYAETVIPLFYESRNYRLAWDDDQLVKGVLDLIENSFVHGLTPADYHYQELQSLRSDWSADPSVSVQARAKFDVLLTDAVLLYVRHLLEGKVNPEPLEYSWNYSRRDFQAEEIVRNLNRALEKGDVLAELDAFIPTVDFYAQMQSELAFYRRLDERQPKALPIADTKVLRLGDSDENIALIRQRLAALQLLDEALVASIDYDIDLKIAVAAFQRMHGLDDDGVIGRQTYAALNTPYSARIDQIRINMERLRWVQDDVSENFVVVNIPGYELYYMKDNTLVWSTEVMVGKVATQTPMFKAKIKYLVFNPTWTVPRSIIRRSLYRKFAADPSYIISKGYKLYNRDGEEVNPASLPWPDLSINNFPYRVVQQPGPDNALGQVKFMFPNKHAIYLHDTGHRSLFDSTARAFSAGCIRVQYPLQLAEILLADNQTWSSDNINAVVDSAALRTVRLKQHVDVLLMYWTTSPTLSGRINFNPDIYQRDANVLSRLDGSPQWSAL